MKRQPFDVHAYLAGHHQIASIWGIGDVQSIRPDLGDGQAWDVLQSTKRNHDAEVGINWDVLGCHAQMLFGDAPETRREATAREVAGRDALGDAAEGGGRAVAAGVTGQPVPPQKPSFGQSLAAQAPPAPAAPAAATEREQGIEF